jgi:glycyl-tRNA synthetase beta chain
MKPPRADFLLEIGCEEMPARMIRKAADELKVILEKHLGTHALLHGGGVDTFGAPRRLVARARGVRLRQADVVREVTGPPKAVAYDAVGKPTRAAESFASKQGVPIAKLFLVSTPKGEYVAARQAIHGREAKELLAEFLPEAIKEISWPRSMYWTGMDGPRFIRPIRWIVALLGAKAIRFSLAGVGAGNVSSGHRFLGKARVVIPEPRDYEPKLRANFVIVQPGDRRRKIEKELSAIVKKKGLRVHPDADLLDMVTYLNEYPTVLIGDFDPAFLDLPQEILVTVMRDHQKYFAVEKRDGELAPHFLAVINLDRDRSGQVRAGHERVLRARFSDARFFWEADQKCRLADNLKKLAQVTYESRLGSYGDKVERLRWLARWLASQWFDAGVHQADVPAADRAAELAKCDLVTEMVREFTELQGIVGGLYARAQGEPDEVAWAIYDHYRPVGLDDPIPRNITGCAVALADKLDSLAACFAVGLVPSGSSDPFALRRAALGVVKILLERKLPLSLSAAVSASGLALGNHAPKLNVTAEIQQRVLDFLTERARFVFQQRHGYSYDEVNAVLAAGADDLVDVARRLEALKAIRGTKNFAPLAVAFKRIRKILEKAGPTDTWKHSAVTPELFSEDAERQLHEAAQRVAQEAGSHKRAGRYREALQVIAGLRLVVDRFFDEVLVMSQDELVRGNRLTLLAELLKEFSTIADFSEVVTEGGK